MTNIPKGYFAARVNSIEEYRRLIAFLKERGYELSYPLDSLSDDDHVKAVMIDTVNKTAHAPSTTIMACYVTCKGRVFDIEEFIT